MIDRSPRAWRVVPFRMKQTLPRVIVAMTQQFLALVALFLTTLTPTLAAEGGAISSASAGWTYKVLAENLYGVDNVVVGSQGELFASFETPEHGHVARIQGSDVEDIAVELHRPDGLAIQDPYLFITEEVDNGSVTRIDLRDLSTTILTRLRGPEGIEVLPNGSLLVAEDHGGRIVLVSQNGQTEILAKGFRQPEGLAVATDGTIYLAETKTGRVLAVSHGQLFSFIEGLDHPDQVEIAPDGALWITEDAKPGRLLRYFNGRTETVMSGLMAPQGIAFGANGDVYVAEQGRNRILAVNKLPRG